MINIPEGERYATIMRTISDLYGKAGLPPEIRKSLDDLTLDIQWLCDKLNTAWATVEAYQRELSRLHSENPWREE